MKAKRLGLLVLLLVPLALAVLLLSKLHKWMQKNKANHLRTATK